MNTRTIAMATGKEARRYARYLRDSGYTARVRETRFGWVVVTNRPVLNK